ncbi:uncharacterized protein LOC121412826 [Lytechinus variegatus]|uniref:uncharacterized protein LOC121412826 n=1 Tax=Lytechinus variegatus TaxID=7654 RepID=UPI001BB1B3DB|nr:uncharacterized protein LOC121412826 [Lytechinus variegatus]
MTAGLRDIILPSPDQKKENLPNPKRTQRPLSDGDILSESYLQRLQSPLPTPEEAVRQHVGPSSLVTVDTSGTGFERMANIRRSLTLTFRMSSRGRKERREKKAWRRTVSGIPREVEEELKNGRARSNSGSEYTSSSSAEFEELRTQSLDRKLKYSVREYNKAYEARKAAGKEGKPSIAVVAPLRNRRRNRHSLGDSSKLEKALNMNGSASLPRGMGLLRPNSVPPGSAMGTVQFSGSSADSSMERIWQTSAVNRLNESAESRKHSGNLRNGKPKLFLPQMSHLPNAVITTQSYVKPIPTETTVMSKANDQHPKPHQQHLRPDPAELAASVRLRMQKSSLRKEDRRSSSGNWSGTDSTRTSVCSEQDSQVTPPANMDASPSDSAVSLSNEVECSQGTPIAPCANSSFPGLINGDGSRPCFLPVQKSSLSTSSGSPTPTNEIEAAGGNFTRLDTETWLKSVGASTGPSPASVHSKPELGNTAPSVKGQLKPQLSFGDSSSESSVENAASIVSDNTSLDLDAYFGDSAEEFPDTDSLSAFSVDQEGYWTSMHSDCGLSPKHTKHPTIPEHPQSVGYDYDIAAHYKGKESRRGFITPRNKVSKDTNQQAPPLPTRDDSFSLDAHLGNLQLQPHLDGSPLSMDSSSPSNQTLTNDSDGSRSVTPAPSDMSDVSSASYDLPPPLCSPNDPQMYSLGYGVANKATGIPGGTASTSRQAPISALSMASGVSSNGLQYTQSLINGVSRLSEASPAATSSQQTSGQNMVSIGLQNHFPAASSAAPASQASDFWATPIPGAMLKARERFYGFKPSPLKPEQQNSQATTESDSDTVTPVTSPRTPSDSNNMFFGMYPGSYSVIRKKSKDSTYTIYSNGMSASLINKPADVISPTNSLDRKQKFNRYVSDLQAQAPQAYDALSQLKAGEERTKAMSREQRAEILEQMRKSKSGGRSSSMATPPATPTSPPVIPTTSNVSALLAISSASESPLNKEEARTTSFRTSYKEGIAAKNLDPDKAIIHAAKRLEDNRTEPDPEQAEAEQTDGSSAESGNVVGRPTTPKNIAVDTADDPEEYTPYVFDPQRQPGSSILKGSAKKDDLHARIHKSKKKLNISTDPFEDTTIGQMMAADSPYDNVPPNIRTIRFSETVTVENTPVRVCLVSGKPRTNMSDFKALLQQQSQPIGSRTVSACYALNVKGNVKGPRNAELLYRGILQEEDDTRKAEDDKDSTDSPVPERKIVTVSDLKNAMASARGNVRMVNVEEAREKHEIVNKSSCATVTAIPEISSLPIRETVINGSDDSPESDVKTTEETVSNHSPASSSLGTSTDDHCKNGCEASGTPETIPLNNNNNHNTDSIHATSADIPPVNILKNNVTPEVYPTLATVVESAQESSEDSTVKRIPKHSWSDTDLNRSNLMAAIRDRGKQVDQREAAVARLEEARDAGKKGSPVRRAMPVSRSEGSIHSILDSVKHSIQKMSPKHEAHDGTDMDYPSDAWD